MWCCCAESTPVEHIPAASAALEENQPGLIGASAVQLRPSPQEEPELQQEAAKEQEPKREEPKREEVQEVRDELKPMVFEVSIQKGRQPVGLEVEYSLVGLRIRTVSPGPVEMYNLVAADPKKVKVGDFIMATNGKSGCQEMINALKTDEELKLRITRPAATTVRISKAGRELGLSLAWDTQRNSCITIKDIKDGAVKSYNASAPAGGLQVQAGDVIEAVNGVSGNAENVVFEMKTAAKVELTLLRLKP